MLFSRATPTPTPGGDLSAPDGPEGGREEAEKGSASPALTSQEKVGGIISKRKVYEDVYIGSAEESEKTPLGPGFGSDRYDTRGRRPLSIQIFALQSWQMAI